MRNVLQATKVIFVQESIVGIKGEIAKLNEIFRLTDMDGLKDNDKKYL